MHEVSIALSILSAVEEVYKSTPGAKRVKAIRVRVGVLSLVDIESLKFALRVASRGTPAEDASIEVVEEEPLFRCRRCGFEWSVPGKMVEEEAERRGIASTMHLYPDIIVGYLRCPRCGSRDVEIVRGKTIVLESVVLDVPASRG